MKTKKITLCLTGVILLLFSLAGLIFIINLTHELSHYDDLKNVSDVSEICVLSYRNNKSFFSSLGAFILYNFNQNNEEEINEIGKYTEMKATAFSFCFVFLYLITLIIIIIFLFKNESKDELIKKLYYYYKHRKVERDKLKEIKIAVDEK